MERRKLGRFPWCGAPFPGWCECPSRKACLSGKQTYCDEPGRQDEYWGEYYIYGRERYSYD